MQARVTAILVARNGAAYLDRTLAALVRQVRRPDSLIVVDAGSSDETAAALTEARATQFVTARGRGAFGDGVSQAIRVAPASESDDDWLWLLAHDNAPEPRALAELLGAIEIAPSVAVAGPKLMRWDKPDTIASYGTTITRFGASVDLVVDELDQAQHDRQSDLLAVSAGGMLVRRSVWTALGGFDPALPHVDAALDFCVRVRLAGHRIVGVPGARVASDGGPELFGRRSVTASARARLERSASLHRRLAWAPAAAVPLHWLSLVPLAVGRSIAQLLAKNPGAVGGEFSAALGAAFDTRVGPARKNIRSTRTLGWSAIAPFRMPWLEVRELRANRRESRVIAETGGPQKQRASFISNGGAWTTLVLLAIGVIAFGPYLATTALTGGSLAPLSASVAELWSNVGYGWRDVSAGFVGAADPFAWVLAVLGTLTFWNPSLSIVILFIVALPLAGLGAWWAATRLAERAWAPAVAAVLWALAPPFLSALTTGHLGSVIAHVLLPWLVVALLGSARSWSAAAASALLMAAIGASAPSLLPVLVLGWLAWLVSHPTRAHRMIAIPIPLVALFAPLAVQLSIAGNLLALFADPGVAVAGIEVSGWHLALAAPGGDLGGWAGVAMALGLPALAAPVVVSVLLAPLAVLSVLALYLPGSRRALAAMILALVGFATAVAATHVAVTFEGATAIPVWPGSGLSVFWLGLVGAAVVALEAFGRGVVAPALAAILAVTVLAGPLLLARYEGTAAVVASSGRMLPALATANAATSPNLGTLELTAQPDGGLAAALHRGTGTTLDDSSVLARSTTDLREAQDRVAVLAGNLASRSGFDSAAELDALGIGFIVSPPVDSDDAQATRSRIAESLDANPLFTAIGPTEFGFLWQYESDAQPEAVRTDGGLPGLGVLLVQGILLGATFLLAVPTPGRRRTPATVTDNTDELATDFDEGTDD
jgi:GT2 family glycosyltransferase